MRYKYKKWEIEIVGYFGCYGWRITRGDSTVEHSEFDDYETSGEAKEEAESIIDQFYYV